jgi:hypothetical protein
MKKQSWGVILLKGILGIIFLLILLGVLNIVSFYVDNFTLSAVTEFLNQNILFIVLISVVLFLGEIFAAFVFPLNIPYPLFNAVGGVLWVEFIFRILRLIDSFIETNLSVVFEPFYILAMVLVVLIVLIVGYVHIFSDLKKKGKPVKKKSEVEWEDVGEEFKEAAYNLASTVKEKLEPKKTKKRIKKRR